MDCERAKVRELIYLCVLPSYAHKAEMYTSAYYRSTPDDVGCIPGARTPSAYCRPSPDVVRGIARRIASKTCTDMDLL